MPPFRFGFDSFGLDALGPQRFSEFDPDQFGAPSFSPQTRRRQTFGDFPEPPPPKSPWLSLMESIKPQPTPGLDQYREHVQNVPTREQYAPSKWRRLGAMFAGGAVGATQGGEKGFNIGSSIVDQPYNSALGQWGVQEQGLRNAATREVEDQKAQNAYMKSVFEMYAKEQAQNAMTGRTNITEAGKDRRLGIQTASAENIQKLRNYSAKILNEMDNMTDLTIADKNIAGRQGVAETAAASGERRSQIAAGASRYGADQSRAASDYRADRSYDAALARIESGQADDDDYKIMSATQLKGVRQQATLELMSQFPNLFRQDGPVQPRIGTGGNATDEFIIQPQGDVDDEDLPEYVQFMAKLKERMDAAKKQLNTPRSGVRINPPPGTAPVAPQRTPRVNTPASRESEWEDVPGIPGMQRRRTR